MTPARTLFSDLKVKVFIVFTICVYIPDFRSGPKVSASCRE